MLIDQREVARKKILLTRAVLKLVAMVSKINVDLHLYSM